MKSIAETVAEMRAREGLTQQELAGLLHVSRSLVAMWEAGERRLCFGVCRCSFAHFYFREPCGWDCRSA